MMYLGKDAVALAKLKDGIGNGWNSIQITNSSAMRLGNELGDWLLQTLPNCSIAIGILNYNTLPSTTGTVYEFFWIGKIDGSSFLRVLNETFDNTSARPMTSTYLAIVDAGATFTVIYK